MNLDLAFALAVFCAVALVTPGPNNTMLMASGLNFGAARTLPHLLGVAFGFSFMVLLVGLGLGSVFAAYPALYAILKYVGAAYLLYLAWMIATSGPVEDGEETRGKPLTFLQGAAFQWVNPKGWVMAIGAVSAYGAVAPFPWNVVLMAGLYLVLGFPLSGVWVLFGHGLRRVLSDPRAVRVFNVVMGLLLAASLWPLLADAIR
jgi:threonine/homoserine/homoserine lactone efflux protein